tara:strand:+ start:1294 stop:1422 length:129 start_codon:yes stop_codon:yes gene_type:complete
MESTISSLLVIDVYGTEIGAPDQSWHAQRQKAILSDVVATQK